MPWSKLHKIFGEHVNSSHPERKSKTKESKLPTKQGGNQEQKK